MSLNNKFIILIILLLFAFPSISSAYIDPGTGSYIIQIVIAGALGSLFTIKLFYKKIKRFFRGKETDNGNNSDEKHD